VDNLQVVATKIEFFAVNGGPVKTLKKSNRVGALYRLYKIVLTLAFTIKGLVLFSDSQESPRTYLTKGLHRFSGGKSEVVSQALVSPLLSVEVCPCWDLAQFKDQSSAKHDSPVIIADFFFPLIKPLTIPHPRPLFLPTPSSLPSSNTLNIFPLPLLYRESKSFIISFRVDH